MSDDLKRIIRQGEIMISLVGRVAFNRNEVEDIVTSKKRDPKKYIEGYNACDGNHTVTELADIIGVKQPTLSPILLEWEELESFLKLNDLRGNTTRNCFEFRRGLWMKNN